MSKKFKPIESSTTRVTYGLQPNRLILIVGKEVLFLAPENIDTWIAMFTKAKQAIEEGKII